MLLRRGRSSIGARNCPSAAGGCGAPGGRGGIAGGGGDGVKSLPLSAPLLDLARHLVWFEPPEKALADTGRFMAYAFARGTATQMAVLREFLDDDALRQSLDRAPPGIIDARSWAYWNLMLDRWPAPPIPRRRL